VAINSLLPWANSEVGPGFLQPGPIQPGTIPQPFSGGSTALPLLAGGPAAAVLHSSAHAESISMSSAVGAVKPSLPAQAESVPYSCHHRWLSIYHSRTATRSPGFCTVATLLDSCYLPSIAILDQAPCAEAWAKMIATTRKTKQA